MQASGSLLGYVWAASPVVKLVLLILLGLSVLSWTYIFQRIKFFKRVTSEVDRFEQKIWSAKEFGALYQMAEKELPFEASTENVFLAGFREFLRIRKLTRRAEKVMEHTERAMAIAHNEQLQKMEKHLSMLATIGSISPYIGLFGTVWGIMMAFHSLSGAEQVSIAMVAPGIAEALVATAIGLFAAIPAVIAYNRFSQMLNTLTTRFENFEDRFSLLLTEALINEEEKVT